MRVFPRNKGSVMKCIKILMKINIAAHDWPETGVKTRVMR